MQANYTPLQREILTLRMQVLKKPKAMTMTTMLMKTLTTPNGFPFQMEQVAISTAQRPHHLSPSFPFWNPCLSSNMPFFPFLESLPFPTFPYVESPSVPRGGQVTSTQAAAARPRSGSSLMKQFLPQSFPFLRHFLGNPILF